MTEKSENKSSDEAATNSDDPKDVSVAPEPDLPAGVYDLSDDDEGIDPADVYKQILDMRDEVSASGTSGTEGSSAAQPPDNPDSGSGSGDAFQALNEKYLRALADLDNLRKRQQKQSLEMRKYGHEGAIREILPVLDNLERAVQASPEQAEGELAKFVEGTQMIIQQFISALGRLGVTPVDAVGERFDPQLHEAMQEIASDEHPRNQVVYQMERGYLLHDRLIRPAKVVVSKGPDGGGASVDDEAEPN